MKDLKSILENRYIDMFKKKLSDESGDRSGIRTSDVTSSCLRRCYFNIISKQDNDFGIEISLNTLNIFFLGHAYHSILISNMFIDKDGEPQLFDENEHKVVFDEVSGMYRVLRGSRVIGIYGAEVPVSYKGMINGRLDELWYDEKNDEVILIDKKTVTKFPQDIYPHYRKQVSYYVVMLSDTFPKLEVRKCGLLYILNKTKYDFQVKCSDFFEVDIETAKEELEGKLKMLNYYLSSGEIPPASPSEFECKYCWYRDRCDAYKKMKSLDYYVLGSNGNSNNSDSDK